MSIDPNPKSQSFAALEIAVVAFSLLLAFLGFLAAGVVLFDVLF